jgi:carbon-monoxide dehydrogenase large subunit
MPAGGWESATVRIEPTGKVTVLTGASPHGQGQETSFAQIAADELGVDLNDVTVIHGDTGIVQYGIGTFGSRATAVGGTAVLIAIQKLKEKAAKIAAHMMQCEASRLRFEAGCYSREEAAAAAVTGKSEPVVPVGRRPCRRVERSADAHERSIETDDSRDRLGGTHRQRNSAGH